MDSGARSTFFRMEIIVDDGVLLGDSVWKSEGSRNERGVAIHRRLRRRAVRPIKTNTGIKAMIFYIVDKNIPIPSLAYSCRPIYFFVHSA